MCVCVCVCVCACLSVCVCVCVCVCVLGVRGLLGYLVLSFSLIEGCVEYALLASMQKPGLDQEG